MRLATAHDPDVADARRDRAANGRHVELRVVGEDAHRVAHRQRLAAAFEQPVKMAAEGGYASRSRASLDSYAGNISRLIGTSGGTFQQIVQTYVVDQSNPVHIALYILLIIFFTYFYVGITFNPEERADEMKKFGGFIPGIRPGRPTAEYLQFVLSRITLPGSLYLGVIAVLPNFFLGLTGSGQNQNFPFGGTAVLIMVGVGLDTVKQIESQLMQRRYDGFLR